MPERALDALVKAAWIAGMRERAALAGGQVEIESGSHGTTVYVHIPLG